MKISPKISINGIPILLKEEKELTVDLGEALRNNSKKEKTDEQESIYGWFNEFVLFIALILFGAIIFEYLSKREKRASEEKFNLDQEEWDEVIHLFKRYEETKSSQSIHELKELFETRDFQSIHEEIYLMVYRLNTILEYKDAILAHIKSLISPLNRRDYFRKKMRCLFKNLDDEHSFNMILN